MSATILLLEDDAVLQDLLREVLQDEGYTVLAANSLAELLQETPQSADLLITDLLVDFQTVGLEAIEQVRRVVRPDLPALICTAARKQIEMLQPQIDQLHAQILEKPFTIDNLVSSVSQMLAPVEQERVSTSTARSSAQSVSERPFSLLQNSFA